MVYRMFFLSLNFVSDLLCTLKPKKSFLKPKENHKKPLKPKSLEKPTELRQSDSLGQFKRRLKTHFLGYGTTALCDTTSCKLAL